MQDEEKVNEKDEAPKNEPQRAGDAPEWVTKVFDFMSTINERLQALEKTPAPAPAPAPPAPAPAPPAPAPAPPAPAPQEEKKQEDQKGNGLYF